MTVLLKATEIRKAIRDNLELPEDAIITLNKSIAVELDDSGKAGEITIKFRANKNANESGDDAPKPKTKKSKDKKPSSKSKSKANGSSNEDDAGLAFAKGEKSKLKKQFEKDLKKVDSDKALLSDFGQIVDLGNDQALVISIDVEGNRYYVRRPNGRTRFLSFNGMRKRVGGDSAKPSSKSKDKKVKAKGKSKDKSSNQEVEFKVVSKKLRDTEEKLSSKEKKALESKFKKQAAKLEKEGVESDWFFKVVKIKNKHYRMMALDAKSKVVKLVCLENGKASKIKLAKLLPF